MYTPHLPSLFIEKIKNYTPSTEAVKLVKNTPLVCVAGITGAGKNTLVHKLLDTGEYHYIVSHTTRAPRLNDGVPETDGVDYHFIDLAAAESMVETKGFIEVKAVHTSVYGTSLGEFVLASSEGKVAIAEVDVQGVKEYVAIKPDTVAVFLLPPTLDIWLSRLKDRYKDDWRAHKNDFAVRFEVAKNEIKHALEASHYQLVVNSNLDETVKKVHSIVKGGPNQDAKQARQVAEALLASIESSGIPK